MLLHPNYENRLILLELMIKQNKKRIRILDIIVYCSILFAAMVSLKDSLNAIALYVAIPASFILCFLRFDTFSTNKYIRFLFFLYLWLCVCTIMAEFYTPAIAQLKRVLGCFLLSYVIASQAKNSRIIPLLYLVYIILLLFAWKYANENILNEITIGDERMNDDKLNANHFAYYTFYVTIAIYILGDILKGKIRKICRILFWATIILAFYTAILTASRQILILQIPLFVTLLYVRYIYGTNKNIIFKSLSIAICGIGILLLYNTYGAEMYDDSLLKQRSETSANDDIRVEIAKESIEIALERPVFGYGPGNAMYQISSGHFTHNTFLELLVNSGIVGFIIFSYMLLYFVRTQYIRWRQTKNQLFLVFMIFGIFWIADQMFYVFYSDIWLISFFILVATHSDVYYKDRLLYEN